MKSYQVLVFEPALTHSVWKDWGSDDPLSDDEVLDLLRAGVESGEYVGWREMTIHKDVLGRDAVALARFNAKQALAEPKGADLHVRMALSCLEELEPEAMRRKQRSVRNFNEHMERESQLSAARVSLDQALAALNP